MSNREKNMRSDIEPGNFVHVSGKDLIVETNVDSDGYFFASNDNGQDFEIYWDDVDHVMVTMSVNFDNDDGFAQEWRDMGFNVDGV